MSKFGKKDGYFLELYAILVILREKRENFNLNQKIQKDTSVSLHLTFFSNISSLEPFRVRGMLGKWVLVKCIKDEFLTDFDLKNKAISKLSLPETYLCPLP